MTKTHILALIFLCRLFSVASVYAQVIKGKISDVHGRPVSNAALFVKELKMGTSANDEGYYELKITSGNYTCVFQCLGYETEIQVVTVADITVHDVVLREKAYEMREVVITNKKEDPAYGIMRRAIAMAPYYMNQVSEYKADVYLKGTFRIDKLSNLVKRMGGDDLNKFKIGTTYLEESFNEIEFAVPNKYQQRVLKKIGNLPNSESNNAMSLVNISVYDPNALADAKIISPLSSSAFAHYRFRYEGFIEEDNRIINKIKITPIRKSKQLVSGYIYIADNYWNVHSFGISGEISLVISVKFKLQTNFGEVNDNVWMPVSHRFEFDMSMLNNSGIFQYISSVKYHHLVENTSIRKPDALLLAEQQRKSAQRNQTSSSLSEKTEPKSKTSATIEKMLEKDNLSNREAYRLARLMQKEADVEKKNNPSLDLTETLRNDYKMTVDSAANKRDTAFWETMRPVPLNPEELKSYQEKEALLANAPQRKDTTKNIAKNDAKKKSPFIRTTEKVLWGTNIKLGKKGGTLYYRGLKPANFGFNTVDGFYIGQKLTYRNTFAKTNNFFVMPEVLWAINRKAVMWDVDASLSYSPVRRGSAQVKFGQITKDFSEIMGIHPLENTVSSLFFRRNYLKLYEDHFVEASNTIDIANGLQLYTKLKYSHRIMLDNTSDYSFFYRDTRDYTSNDLQNAELKNPLTDHSSTVFLLNLNYTPRFYYRIDHNNRKRMVKSDFPTFFATWQKGVNGLLGSDSNFDYMTGGLRQKIETGLMQEFHYMMRGGVFINQKNVYFPDFRHFATIEIPATIKDITQQNFNLLQYYRFSTSDKYLEAHLYYFAPFLLLKFLPFFSNRLWQEGFQVNYLYTNEIRNYTELGYTIGLLWRAGFYAGFENFKFRSFGFKISLPISNSL